MALLGVRIDGSSMNMNGTVDGDGDRFVVEDIEGLDSPDADIVTGDIAQDGASFKAARYKQRELLVKGTAVTPAEFGTFRCRDKIADAFTDYFWGYRSLWVDIPSPGTSVMLTVRPGGKIHFPPPKGSTQPFEIPLTADDPRKYAQSATTVSVNGTGGTVVNNIGNYPTFVKATLTSQSTNAYLENTTAGATITLGGTVPAGSYIDFLNREVVDVNNGVQEIANRPRTWWPIYPGANTLRSNAPFSVEFRSAWL